MDEAAVQQVRFAELDALQSSQQLAEKVTEFCLGKLVAEAEVRASPAEAQMGVR